MPPDHALPDDAFEETHLAGTGPGGQNANKVATAVQLRVDLARLDLDAWVKAGGSQEFAHRLRTESAADLLTEYERLS